MTDTANWGLRREFDRCVESADGLRNAGPSVASAIGRPVIAKRGVTIDITNGAGRRYGGSLRVRVGFAR